MTECSALDASSGRIASAGAFCAEASPGQILISQRIYAAVHDLVAAKEVGPLQLKGFHRPVVVYEIAHLKQPGT